MAARRLCTTIAAVQRSVQAMGLPSASPADSRCGAAVPRGSPLACRAAAPLIADRQDVALYRQHQPQRSAHKHGCVLGLLLAALQVPWHYCTACGIAALQVTLET